MADGKDMGDEYAIIFDASKYSDNWLVAAVENSLYQRKNKGHTATSESELIPLVKKNLGSKELVVMALSVSCKNAAFIKDEKTGAYHSNFLFDNGVN
jgi:hypothetical protein